MAYSDKDKKRFLDILYKHKGLVSNACKEFNMARATYFDWLRNPDFAQAVEDVHEAVLDWAESVLQEKIADKDGRSVEFFLKAKGKKRGYGDTLDVHGNLKIDIKLPGLDDDENLEEI